MSFVLSFGLPQASANHPVHLATHSETQQVGHCHRWFRDLLRQNAEHNRRLKERSSKHLIANMNREIRLGVVTAAAGDNNHHYKYVWRRDAGLVMDVIAAFYRDSPLDREENRRILEGYIAEVIARSHNPGQSGLSGVKYSHKDNAPFTEIIGPKGKKNEWMDPQHDGPAIESNTIVAFIKRRLTEGLSPIEAGKLLNATSVFDPSAPFTGSTLQLHADHIVKTIGATGFDLWETVKGSHLHTALVQRRALIETAEIAEWMGDKSRAEGYLKAARQTEALIDEFWDPARGVFVANRGVEFSLDPDKFYWDGHKLQPKSGLDISSLLGVLHGETAQPYISVTDDRLIATLHRLELEFINLFPVNQQDHFVGVAIGRFPEDRYDGHENTVYTLAHAWVLATAAYAEWHYKMAMAFSARGKVEISELNLPYFQKLSPTYRFHVGAVIQSSEPMFAILIEELIAKGDSYMTRIVSHMNLDGTLSEQIDRFDGTMIGAHSLNWSYASVIKATMSREKIQLPPRP